MTKIRVTTPLVEMDGDEMTRIIWASGYPRNQKDQQSENYLQKPFTAQDLLRKVKETMTE